MHVLAESEAVRQGDERLLDGAFFILAVLHQLLLDVVLDDCGVVLHSNQRLPVHGDVVAKLQRSV